MSERDMYERSIDVTPEKMTETREYLTEIGFIEDCKVEGHDHASGDHVTISEKGARSFIELSRFVGADMIAELAMKRAGEELVDLLTNLGPPRGGMKL